MNTRQVTIYHFEPDRDIGQLLSKLTKLAPNENDSLPIGGNLAQFRGIKVNTNNIMGRLCKVRIVGKPTVGKAFASGEQTLQGDVIETCFFLYHKTTNRLLVQKNSSVTSAPNSLMSKLLVKIYPDIGVGGLGIEALFHPDALKRIIEGRGSVTNITVKTDAEQRNYLQGKTGSSLDFSDTMLGDTQYKQLTLVFSIGIGKLKTPAIKRLYDLFKTNRIKDASFEIEGDRTPIKLSAYAMYDKIAVDVDDNGDIVASDMFAKLNEINITIDDD